MSSTNSLFRALNINDLGELREFSSRSGIPTSKLKYYDQSGSFPDNVDLQAIITSANISELELRLKTGTLNQSIINAIEKHASAISEILKEDLNQQPKICKNYELSFETNLGRLYQGDCLSLMDNMEKASVDLIFADPPFNLNKSYESNINDNISETEYLAWTEKWVTKCVDLLADGGSMFVWNLPKWNTYISGILNKHLNFRHWIAVDIKYRLPIKNKLYPSHYSLLYYTKGEKPKTFNEQRIPLDVCRHCGGDVRDYGGYKDKLNPSGINLSDVWYDIPPVRHSKYKTRDANELSMKLLERIISMSSNEEDLVFDPFGGSGTTYIVAEILRRNWIGIELGPIETIKDRFANRDFHQQYIKDVQKNKDTLFTEASRRLREKNNHWLPETLTITRRKKETAVQVSVFEGTEEEVK